ncbi:hypothetical protein OESDEN_16725 [Oesophagostomum dentatum]|uniref:F-box associated domain-containing protein n=1 Tax=Oesophagostomum dentatum TaxID=61180 RepID=A0A0B1SK41_OESDE|nr:hypothetical protein OESDEN_16725 [Oesophagostomum dentatum]
MVLEIDKWKIEFFDDGNNGCIRFMDEQLERVLTKQPPKTITEASFIHISAVTGITNEQLVHLRTTRISLRAPQISSWGINNLIKQWISGDRRITNISLTETRNLDANSIVKDVDPSCLVSEAALLRVSFIQRKLEPMVCMGVRSGLRNKSGNLLVLDVCTNSCNIFDPYLLDLHFS